MPIERIPPKKMIAANLRVLIDIHETSPPAMEAKLGGKPTRKTITNMLNAKHDSRLTEVEKVAGVFGLTAWQLLAHDMSVKPAGTKDIFALLEHFVNADSVGRALIMQTAEMAASKAAK